MSVEQGRLVRSIKAAPAKSAKPRRRKLNQAGRPTAVELERRKGKVMDVATELFVAQGYAATSLVDIARGAGVATRTLYQHFGDKEAIFREVIFARDVGAALDKPMVQAGDTLFTALQRGGNYVYEVTFREKSIGLMRLMIAESTRFPEFMQSVATSIFGRFRRNIERLFESMEAAGLIPSGHHARSAELFFDLVLGSNPIMVYTHWSAEPPSQADLDERIELFIRGRFDGEVAKVARTREAVLA
jgi:TetR/AcrR family transcriptional regulator, mexJK operon transcriptional repressor